MAYPLLASKMLLLLITVVAVGSIQVAEATDSNKEVTEDAEDGKDFTNDLFSDLGPILALFGEQVTKQFMAGSMGWSDNILFAMVLHWNGLQDINSRLLTRFNRYPWESSPRSSVLSEWGAQVG